MVFKFALALFLAGPLSVFASTRDTRPNPDRELVSMILSMDHLATTVSGAVYDHLRNKGVIAFAKNDIGRHEANRDAFSQLERPVEPNVMTAEYRPFLDRAQDQLFRLEVTQIENLDKVYIDLRAEEIALELAALNQIWIPRSKSPQVKKLLLKLRPVVAHELKTIQAIQRSLNSPRYTQQ